MAKEINKKQYLVTDVYSGSSEVFDSLEKVQNYIENLINEDMCEDDVEDYIAVYEIVRELDVSVKKSVSVE